MKTIPGLAGGRDKRLLVKHEPDDQLDLILYKFGCDNGISEYHQMLGVALREWLMEYLQDVPQHRWQLDTMQPMGGSKLYSYALSIIMSLPLARWGFKTPTMKSALRHAAQVYLKKRGVLP